MDHTDSRTTCIQPVFRIADATACAVAGHLDRHVTPHLAPDVSNYARGRQRAWLQIEAPLGPTQPWRPGLASERLWPWLVRVWQRFHPASRPAVGLAIHGDTGIAWHRDAAYARSDALIVNLGPATFEIDARRDSANGRPDDPVSLDLGRGDVVAFDCTSTASSTPIRRAGRSSSGGSSGSLRPRSSRSRSRDRRGPRVVDSAPAWSASPPVKAGPVPGAGRPRPRSEAALTGGSGADRRAGPSTTRRPHMTVLNLRRIAGDTSAEALLARRIVRVDRATPWGNRFRIGRDGTRTEVIERYRRDLWRRIRAGEVDLDELAALDGAELACWCAPLPCHAEVLARAAAWAADK